MQQVSIDLRRGAGFYLEPAKFGWPIQEFAENALRHTATYGRGSVGDSKCSMTGSEPRAQQAVFRVFQQTPRGVAGLTKLNKSFGFLQMIRGRGLNILDAMLT